MDRERVLAKFRGLYLTTKERADQHGWVLQHSLDDSENFLRMDLRLDRGGETIKIWWEDGRLIEAPTYEIGGVLTKLRNHSALMQQLEKQPDIARAKRKAQKASRRGESSIQLLDVVRALPWDPEEMDDRSLKAAVYGRTLVWLNKLTGLPEQDQIWYGHWIDGRNGRFVADPKSGPNWNAINFHITKSSTGRRVINFVGKTGYRSVAVDTLLQVL